MSLIVIWIIFMVVLCGIWLLSIFAGAALYELVNKLMGWESHGH